MGLVLTEDEAMLRDTAESFFADKAPVAALRALRDNEDADGLSRELWREMAEMGLAGVLVPEEYGGVDMGFQAAGLIAEQIGRNLTASPFLSTAVLAATALRSAGNAQAGEWLEKIAAGDAIFALALDEGRKHAPAKTAARAEKSGNGYKISGSKCMVLNGHIADQLIVAARVSGEPGDADGISLFLVDPETDGVEIERTIMVDSHNAARIEFDEVQVTADAMLGAPEDGEKIISAVLNAGRAALSAELLGAGAEAFRITTDYIKERKQFGAIIGSFQALQHRAAHLYAEVEIARSAVLSALTALDAGDEKAGLYCAMTKAKLGDVAKLAGIEGVQMHGGVGMTDEYDIGLYLKRIRVLQELFGDAHFHADAIASASGY